MLSMLTEKNTYNRLDTSSTNRSTCQQRDEQNKQVRRKLCRNSVLAVCGDKHSVGNPLRVSSWSRQAVVVDVLDQKQVVVMRHSQKRYHPSSGAGSQGRGFGGLLSHIPMHAGTRMGSLCTRNLVSVWEFRSALQCVLPLSCARVLPHISSREREDAWGDI